MDEIVTPCVGVCRLDAAGAVCLGCDRTLGEIAAWTQFGEDERRAIMARLTSAKSPPLALRRAVPWRAQ